VSPLSNSKRHRKQEETQKENNIWSVKSCPLPETAFPLFIYLFIFWFFFACQGEKYFEKYFGYDLKNRGPVATKEVEGGSKYFPSAEAIIF
jgi:hypothetical protein